ncbi:MAG: serine/threonine protein kinase [Planctomycetes bacterium]|nr:serine/threonine protein kinase [Planctomycetota bacterium]
MISKHDIGFARIAVKNGFLTDEKSEQVFDYLRSAREFSDDPMPIENIVVSQGFMTNEQATAVSLAYQRLRRDAEKKRWAIAGYEIYNKLGEGGLGVVFKAKQISMNRLVALKILHKRWVNDEEFKKRFLVEARLVGKLSHQNLIKVYDVGREDWKYYFSMEYVENVTVEEMIERGHGGMGIAEATDIVIQTLRAVKYLMGYDIVHCDIKPSNMLISTDGVAKLGDFGFVKSKIDIKVTDEGSVLGTPDYISPEQALGEAVDFRSDIYSLGTTYYHMVTGQTPYEGTVSTKMRRHIKGDAPNPAEIKPELPRRVCEVVVKMMARRKEDRYQSTEELFADLERVKAEAVQARSADREASGAARSQAPGDEVSRLRRQLVLWRALSAAALAAAATLAALFLT